MRKYGRPKAWMGNKQFISMCCSPNIHRSWKELQYCTTMYNKLKYFSLKFLLATSNAINQVRISKKVRISFSFHKQIIQKFAQRRPK